MSRTAGPGWSIFDGQCNPASLLLAGAYFLTRGLYWSCPPVWDGIVYYTLVVAANEAPFDLLRYSTDGHICQGFFLVMSLPYQLFKRDYFLFNLWLTLFGFLSVVAFYKLLAHFSQDRMKPGELALATALFAFHPSVLANMIHFNLDIGVMTFFLWYWLLLLKGRIIWATLFALLMMFSKESAYLLLPVPFLFCLFLQPGTLRIRWIVRNSVVLVVPCVTLAAFLYYKTVVRGQPPFWIEYANPEPLKTALNLFSGDFRFKNFVAMTFLLNFNWLLTLIGIALIAAIAFKRNLAPEQRADLEPASQAKERVTGNTAQLKTAFLLYLLFVCATAALLLVRPYSHVRYLLPLFPIIILCAYQWSLLAAVPQRTRIAVGIALLCLFGIQNVRTIDPVSRAYFGTFDFGKHKLLTLTKPTDEAMHYGVDQLVYNLEFLKLRQLLAKAIRDVRPTENTFIACNRYGMWQTFTRLKRGTYDLTFETGPDTFSPRYVTASAPLKLPEPPPEIYYFAFPNWGNKAELALLSEHYPKKTERVYDIAGYQMSVWHFHL